MLIEPVFGTLCLFVRIEFSKEGPVAKLTKFYRHETEFFLKIQGQWSPNIPRHHHSILSEI